MDKTFPDRIAKKIISIDGQLSPKCGGEYSENHVISCNLGLNTHVYNKCKKLANNDDDKFDELLSEYIDVFSWIR